MYAAEDFTALLRRVEFPEALLRDRQEVPDDRCVPLDLLEALPVLGVTPYTARAQRGSAAQQPTQGQREVATRKSMHVHLRKWLRRQLALDDGCRSALSEPASAAPSGIEPRRSRAHRYHTTTTLTVRARRGSTPG